jgi:hypothetical protein
MDACLPPPSLCGARTGLVPPFIALCQADDADGVATYLAQHSAAEALSQQGLGFSTALHVLAALANNELLRVCLQAAGADAKAYADQRYGVWWGCGLLTSSLRTPEGWSPLHFCCNMVGILVGPLLVLSGPRNQDESAECARVLLEFKADATLVNMDKSYKVGVAMVEMSGGRTPLHQVGEAHTHTHTHTGKQTTKRSNKHAHTRGRAMRED